MVRRGTTKQPELVGEKERDLILREFERARTDVIWWFENWCFTWDPHDRQHGRKPYPSYKQAPWLYKLIETLHTENRILVPKSRQMMISWTVCADLLWDTQFHQQTRTFMTSKKEKDAGKLVDRCKFIYRAQPVPREFLPTVPHFGAEIGNKLELPFPDINSIIEGLSQGSEAIRMETASNVFSDEMAFQDKAEEDFRACMPTLGDKGRYIGVSSANLKNFFWRMCYDKVE